MVIFTILFSSQIKIFSYLTDQIRVTSNHLEYLKGSILLRTLIR